MTTSSRGASDSESPDDQPRRQRPGDFVPLDAGNPNRDHMDDDDVIEATVVDAIIVNDDEPAGADATAPRTEPAPDDRSLVASLTYGISIPERAARSASAMVGGVINETAGRLIPATFRSSKSYEVFVQQAINMMMHDIGGVRPTGDGQADEDEAKLARKAVGGLLDVAGVATLHLSPIAVLAIVNDIAYGSGYYLRKLSEELKREGVIDPSSSIDHVSDLLEALQKTSSEATDAINMPPVDVESFRKTVDQLTAEIAQINPRNVLPQPEVTRLWNEMEKTARQENVGLWDVSTTMTMFAMNRLNLTSKGALASVHVAGSLLDDHVLQHYSDALNEIRDQGIYAILATASAPYLDAVWHNFDGQRETWTEELASGRLLGKAVTSVRGWLGST